MRIIISDTSCMIDLRKTDLLHPLLALPYTVAMPDMLFEDEFLCLSSEDKLSLCQRGLEVRALPGDLVVRAQEHRNRHRRLKLADCFALTLAEHEDESILLTGDASLREVATNEGIEAHGVLWVIDQIHEHTVAPAESLHDALQVLLDDPMVFLPQDEIRIRLRRLARLF
jgi:predicted nucleic acid-binding protein